jgi:hypothetical protein
MRNPRVAPKLGGMHMSSIGFTGALAAICALTVAAPDFSRAALIIDQSQTVAPCCAVPNEPPMGQSFTPGLPGIDFAIFRINNPNVPTQLTISLHTGENGALLATSIPANIAPGSDIDVEFQFANRIPLTPSLRYSLMFDVDSSNDFLEFLNTTFSSFATGNEVIFGQPRLSGDFFFIEGINTSAVDEPTSLALLLVGLIAVHRQLRRKTNLRAPTRESSTSGRIFNRPMAA